MAKIIYREGMEGQNKLSCIEGIEIELLNGQKALIYPKYAARRMNWTDILAENLEVQAKSSEAKEEIRRIIMSSYHNEEWKAGLI